MSQFNPPKSPMIFSQTIIVEQLSYKNSFSDKPNEDAVFVDLEKSIFALADGVSRIRAADGTYPNPSPASEASRLLVTQSSRFIVESVLPITAPLLDEAFRFAGASIASYNKVNFPNPDFGVNDYAGAVGIIGSLDSNTLRYAYVGDCVGMIVRGGSVRRFTVNQTEAIEEYIRAHKGITDLEQTIRREIRNNPSHPLSWGVLTGEESAYAFIKTGELSLERGDRVLFCSDGLLGVIGQYTPLLAKGSAKELVNAMCQLEECGNYRSDDKTLILIDVG